MIDTGLKNKVVLITGVNNPHGICAAIARAFSAQGAVIFVTYLRLPAKDSRTDFPGEEFYRAQNAKQLMKSSQSADRETKSMRGKLTLQTLPPFYNCSIE